MPHKGARLQSLCTHLKNAMERTIMSRLEASLHEPGNAQRITDAVKQAEGGTAGEIVPYVVSYSDHYEEAMWRGGFLCTTLVLVGILAFRSFTAIWLPQGLTPILLSVLLAQGLGMTLVFFVPSLKRLFAGPALLERRVTQQAKEAFVAEEVFNTRDRSGILIFVSFLEHRVIVMADTGIDSKVPQSQWQEVVQLIVDSIRAGKVADGLVAAIGRCGELLRQHGVSIRPEDANELADTLRIRK